MGKKIYDRVKVEIHDEGYDGIWILPTGKGYSEFGTPNASPLFTEGDVETFRRVSDRSTNYRYKRIPGKVYILTLEEDDEEADGSTPV